MAGSIIIAVVVVLGLLDMALIWMLYARLQDVRQQKHQLEDQNTWLNGQLDNTRRNLRKQAAELSQLREIYKLFNMEAPQYAAELIESPDDLPMKYVRLELRPCKSVISGSYPTCHDPTRFLTACIDQLVGQWGSNVRAQLRRACGLDKEMGNA